MSRKPRIASLKSIVNQLLEGIAATDEEQRDISCLGELLAPLQCSQLIASAEIGCCGYAFGRGADRPIYRQYQQEDTVCAHPSKLIKAVTRARAYFQPDPNAQLASELLQILTDLYTSYPSLATRSSIQAPAIESLLQVLDSARPTLRKRAIPAVTALVATNPALFDKPVKGKIVEGLSKGGEGARIWVGLIASLAKGQSVGKIGGLVGEGELIGMILDQASDPTETEAVEGSLSVSREIIDELNSDAQLTFRHSRFWFSGAHLRWLQLLHQS